MKMRIVKIAEGYLEIVEMSIRGVQDEVVRSVWRSQVQSQVQKVTYAVRYRVYPNKVAERSAAA
jgi:hypothetical protein